MLMDWCDSCQGRGGSHEFVPTEVYQFTENVVAWVPCEVCEGSGLVRDSDDSAFERLQARKKNVVGE